MTATRARINLSVKQPVRDRIDRLKDATDCETDTEVIRLALVLMEKLVEARASGRRVEVEGEDGTMRELMLIL